MIRTTLYDCVRTRQTIDGDYEIFGYAVGEEREITLGEARQLLSHVDSNGEFWFFNDDNLHRAKHGQSSLPEGLRIAEEIDRVRSAVTNPELWQKKRELAGQIRDGKMSLGEAFDKLGKAWGASGGEESFEQLVDNPATWEDFKKHLRDRIKS